MEATSAGVNQSFVLQPPPPHTHAHIHTHQPLLLLPHLTHHPICSGPLISFVGEQDKFDQKSRSRARQCGTRSQLSVPVLAQDGRYYILGSQAQIQAFEVAGNAGESRTNMHFTGKRKCKAGGPKCFKGRKDQSRFSPGDSHSGDDLLVEVIVLFLHFTSLIFLVQ